MSSSGVPRKAGMTPTNAGRFLPPSSAPISGRRRGLTPRSSSKKKPVGGASANLPKQKLTVEQQLQIFQRLKAGNYKKGEGLKQFYDEFCGTDTSVVSKMTCKQNLYASFAAPPKSDRSRPLASSTRNYGSGRAGSNESLVSLSSSILSSVPSHCTTVIAADLTIMQKPDSGSQFSEADEDDVSNLPDYIKLFNKIVEEKENHLKCLQRLASATCKVKFAELLPKEKIVEFFKSLDRVQLALQKFLNSNASENMHLLMPAPPSKGSPVPFIRCDVARIHPTIQSVYKLSKLLTQLDEFSMESRKDLKFEAKIDSFKETVGELEKLIQKQEEYSLELRSVIKQTDKLSMGEDDEDGIISCEGGPENQR